MNVSGFAINDPNSHSHEIRLFTVFPAFPDVSFPWRPESSIYRIVSRPSGDKLHENDRKGAFLKGLSIKKIGEFGY